HLLDSTDSPDRMQGGKIVLLHIKAYDKPVDHLGIDHGGVDGVDADPLRGILESSSFRQSDDGVLRGNVNRHVREPNHPRDRRAVHDGAAATLEHPWDL